MLKLCKSLRIPQQVVGATKEQTFTITNHGGSELMLSATDPQITGPGAASFSVSLAFSQLSVDPGVSSECNAIRSLDRNGALHFELASFRARIAHTLPTIRFLSAVVSFAIKFANNLGVSGVQRATITVGTNIGDFIFAIQGDAVDRKRSRPFAFAVVFSRCCIAVLFALRVLVLCFWFLATGTVVAFLA